MSTEPQTAWAPQACTLPAEERPLRVAEFDELFATSVRGVERRESTALRMELDATDEVAARTASLVMREAGCCSFFTFSLVATGGRLRLDITVPEAEAEVLNALQAQATAAAR
ncbi:hypothetical protein JOF56_008701 [Kibdelosporangium banguiense]|uniref:Arsenate reductase n=1 Tax=Kibdelosporangium banguiense TaxID=1365924 RepID=A0ABS4TWM2_9PSEU|nr:hypothetical protein [Kibdelosporangium banguiense]MBP2328316.1 hypothetical protein [Kibdelosporangium banguiense]